MLFVMPIFSAFKIQNITFKLNPMNKEYKTKKTLILHVLTHISETCENECWMNIFAFCHFEQYIILSIPESVFYEHPKLTFSTKVSITYPNNFVCSVF